MRKKLIAANWKMNMLNEEAKDLSGGVVRRLQGFASQADVVIAPPFTSLGVVYRQIIDTGIELGAQNVFWKNSGAFTGEVSPDMIMDVGCTWVIVGHSERRKILGETDEMVRRKIEASLDAGLSSIVCVGETGEEREEGREVQVIKSQVESATRGLELNNPSGFVIAYEPIWAIGTGQNAEPAEIERVHGVIREILNEVLGDENSGKIRIVYGGSVSPENAVEILTRSNIDGALVGGASLDEESFSKIVLAAGE